MQPSSAMPAARSRRTAPQMAEDRISALPDTVLLHVLSFLSTIEAVATSVLAKRWRFLWHSVSTIDFDNTSSIKRKKNYLRFVQSVYIALNSGNLHRPIHTFRLGCSSYFSDAINFNTWINVALQRRVEHLDVRLNHCKSPIALSSCTTLVYLNLERLSLKLLTSIEFPSLKILHLNEVSFSERARFVELLSASPVIEDLDATYLEFDDDDDDDSSTMKQYQSLPKLVKACITNFDVPFQAVNNAEFLQVDWIHDKDEEVGANPSYKQLIPVFPNLTRLELSDQSMTVYWLELVVEVLDHSPKLQSLSIDKNVEDEALLYEIDECEWTFPRIVPECISSHLKTFCFDGYIGTDGEFQLVSYIMENATRLQSITICTPSIAEAPEKLEMVKKLTMCTRKSSSCKLSFT